MTGSSPCLATPGDVVVRDERVDLLHEVLMELVHVLDQCFELLGDVPKCFARKRGIKPSHLGSGVENLQNVGLRRKVPTGVEDARKGSQGRGHLGVALVSKNRGVGGLEVVTHEVIFHFDDVIGQGVATWADDDTDGNGELSAAHSWHVLAQHRIQELRQQTAPLVDEGACGHVVGVENILYGSEQVQVELALQRLYVGNIEAAKA